MPDDDWIYLPQQGVEIQYNVWRGLWDELEDCLHSCGMSMGSCTEACPPDPPAAALACIEGCSTLHGLCTLWCRGNYDAQVRFYGRPQIGNGEGGGGGKDPQPTLNDIKTSAKKNVHDINWLSVGFAAGGFILTIASDGADLAVAAILQTASRLMTGQGIAWQVSRLKLQEIADDPPSSDFGQIWQPRRFDIDDFIPEPLRNSEIGQILLPLTIDLLSAASMSEAIAESLNRATGAGLANDQGMYLAQLRVSQGYSLAFSDALRRAHDSRISAADKLRGFAIDDSDGDLLFRLRAVARSDGLSLSDTRLSLNEFIISYDRVVALLDQWRSSGVDPQLMDQLSKFQLDQQSSSDIVNSILSTRLYRIDYDKPIADILLRPEFTSTENELIESFQRWGNWSWVPASG